MALPVLNDEMGEDEKTRILENAANASAFLKAISGESRLMILCQLAGGEKSVIELEKLLSARQAAVSQQLARLRLEGLIAPRREGKAIYYRIVDPRALSVIETVYDLFCHQPEVVD